MCMHVSYANAFFPLPSVMVSDMCNLSSPPRLAIVFPRSALLYAISSLSPNFHGPEEFLESRPPRRHLGDLLITSRAFWAEFLCRKAACSFKWVPQPQVLGACSQLHLKWVMIQYSRIPNEVSWAKNALTPPLLNHIVGWFMSESTEKPMALGDQGRVK